MTITSVVCAWCNKLLKGKANEPPENTSHDICPDCRATHFPETVEPAK